MNLHEILIAFSGGWFSCPLGVSIIASWYLIVDYEGKHLPF